MLRMMHNIENPQLKQLTWLLHSYDGDSSHFNNQAQVLIQDFYAQHKNANLTFADGGSEEPHMFSGSFAAPAIEVVRLHGSNEIVPTIDGLHLPSSRVLGALVIAVYGGEEGFLCIPKKAIQHGGTPGLFMHITKPPILSVLRRL